MMLPMLPAPGSKLGEFAARIEAEAMKMVPTALRADLYFRERLHAHCIEQAMKRGSDTVQ